MGAGKVGDVSLALLRQVFEPGVRAGFHEVRGEGAEIISSESGGMRRGVHGRGKSWIDEFVDWWNKELLSYKSLQEAAGVLKKRKIGGLTGLECVLTGSGERAGGDASVPGGDREVTES